MTTEFETYMREWIMGDLSTPLEILNNLPKCPYAKTAYLENKVMFFDGSELLFDVLETIADTWIDEKIEVAVIKLADSVDADSMTPTVDMLNSVFESSDFVFLDDHNGNEERMKDVVFNNGKYNVLFMQRKSKLDLATKKLEKLGYYKNWTKEYYDEVVGWRSHRP